MDSAIEEARMYETILAEYGERWGCRLERAALDRFAVYARALLEWNKRFNLTRITEYRDVYIKHFVDSVAALQIYEVRACGELLDVGSGAGFPGLALKIARPEMGIVLCDSLIKRVTFLEHATAMLSVSAECVHGRAEDLARRGTGYRDRFPVVIARAVAPMPVLAEWCMPFVQPGGVFVAMKGRFAQDELREAAPAIMALKGEVSRVEPYTLPYAEGERELIVVCKTAATPARFPRRAGEAVRRPLRGPDV